MSAKNMVVVSVLGLLLTGCASSGGGVFGPSKPISIGEDTYLMNIESTSIGVATKKVMLIEKATEHCQSMGKKMDRIASNQNRGGLVGDFVLDIEYRCLSK